MPAGAIGPSDAGRHGDRAVRLRGIRDRRGGFTGRANVLAVEIHQVNPTAATSVSTWIWPGAFPPTPIPRGVLANDSDADGDALAAVRISGPDHGSLAFSRERLVRVSSQRTGFSGEDHFIYQAVDTSGAASNQTTVTIAVQPTEAPAAAGRLQRRSGDQRGRHRPVGRSSRAAIASARIFGRRRGARNADVRRRHARFAVVIRSRTATRSSIAATSISSSTRCSKRPMATSTWTGRSLWPIWYVCTRTLAARASVGPKGMSRATASSIAATWRWWPAIWASASNKSQPPASPSAAVQRAATASRTRLAARGVDTVLAVEPIRRDRIAEPRSNGDAATPPGISSIGAQTVLRGRRSMRREAPSVHVDPPALE